MDILGYVLAYEGEWHYYLCPSCYATVPSVSAPWSVLTLTLDDQREESYLCDDCDALILHGAFANEEECE